MDVVSLSPVPVASYRWRLGDRPWMFTLLCKVTLELEPGEAKLAKEHDPIHLRDVHSDGSKTGSVYAPSDLAPGRPLVDIMLVGDAFAPKGKPTRSLTARLRVASLDKSVVVAARDGAKAFRAASLDHRLAKEPVAGGPELSTTNQTVELLAVAGSDDGTGEALPAFGPISRHWPLRQKLLKGAVDPSPIEERVCCKLPAEFDLRYFNAAPPDQQLPELLVGAPLVLENLHPEHSSLETRLPKLTPQMFVQRAGDALGERQEIQCAIEALWIDTRRGVATVTWRGETELAAGDEHGKVWVVLPGTGRRLSSSGLTKLMCALGGPASQSEDSEDDDDPLARTASMRAHRAAKRDIADEPSETETSVLSREALERSLEHTADHAPRSANQAPPWFGRRNRSSPPPLPTNSADPTSSHDASPSPALSTPLPTGPPRAMLGTRPGIGLEPAAIAAAASHPGRESAAESFRNADLGDTSSLPEVAAEVDRYSSPVAAGGGTKAQRAYAQAGGAATVPRSAGTALSAAPVLAPIPMPRQPPMSAPGAITPPNPIADSKAIPSPKARAVEPQSEPAPQPKSARDHDGVELVWFERGRVLSLRRRWQRLCDELDFAPPNLQHDLPSRDHALKREHHLCFGVLTQAPAGDGRTLEPALRDAFGASGRFTPPLVLLTGVLALGFDPLARLRALADIIDPIGGDDRKLKAALARVDKLAGAPVLANDQRAIDSITDDLLKCYADAGRDLKLEYVEQAAERSVLEQRRYHTRMLLGGEHIRASLSFDGPGSAAAGEAPVPTYLPIALKSELPLLDTMRARLIAELNVRQDQFEAHPLALRVVALGRIIETPYP